MVIALLACRAPQPDTAELGTFHAVTLRPLENRDRLRHTMREQRNALLDLQSYLASGRLDEGRAMGFLIAEGSHGPPSPASRQVVLSARVIADAHSVEQAKLAMPSLVSACGGCHPFVLGRTPYSR